jgi:phosphoglycolate phosphatase
MSGTKSSRRRAVLFDLDGTLVDSFPGIADAYRHVLIQLGLDDMEDAELKQFIGPPIQEVFRRNLGLNGRHLDDAIQLFREHYGTKGLFRFSKYPGVEEMLSDLHSQGVALYIATSKLRTLALDIVEHAGWADVFTGIGGAEADGIHLKKDVIARVISHIPSDARVLAMVGDRAADIAGGRQLGLTGVGVAWGYGSIRELTEAGATSIAKSPNELVPVIACFD